MKHFLLGYLFLIFSISAFSQNATIRPNIRKFKNDTIIWKSDSLLKKEDFKSRAKPNGPLGFTASGMFLYSGESAGQLIIYVEALFVKSKSYITKYSEYVLKHEQIHFDICELYARKLRKKLTETNFKKVKKIQVEINDMYSNVSSQLQKEQEKYDKDTEHGLNSAKQSIWSEEIRKQIQALDEYKLSGIDISK